MTTKRLQKLPVRPGAALGAACIVAAGAAGIGIFAEPVLAQQQAVAPAAATPAPSKDGLLGLDEIERRVSATGVRVTEIKLRDRIVEVEGRDSSNREVELVVDRRTGEILSRKIDD